MRSNQLSYTPAQVIILQGPWDCKIRRDPTRDRGSAGRPGDLLTADAGKCNIGTMKTSLRLLRNGVTPLTVLLLLLGGMSIGALDQTPAPAPIGTFASPAFKTAWERSDALVAQGAVSRTWLWGPTPGPAMQEPWAESPGGARQVQYFDKGRMEITNPGTPPTDPFFVTNGLLATELISGQVQLGANTFAARAPAEIPVAGDRDDPTAPTYASFNSVASFPGADRRVADATGQPVNQALARDGTVTTWAPPNPDYGLKVAYFDPTTGHNIPDVFWTFLNNPGTVLENGQVVPRRLFDPWYSLTGLPISEAYWSSVKIAGKYSDVLIQAFQRRVLTYAPHNPTGFQVEMGNIGLHYLEWRYGIVSGGSGPTPAPAATPTPALPPNIQVQALANAQAGLDLNNQTITLANGGKGAADMTGWQLVSPQGDHDEVYRFPQFVLPAGATVVVHAGWGYASATQLYMDRVTWYFSGTNRDGVVLYDAQQQEVTRYFLSEGPPATVPPAATETPAVTDTPVLKETPTPGPAEVTETPSPTATLPKPQPTSGEGTSTPTPTETPAVVPTGTPTPHVYDDGTSISAWVDNPKPNEGDVATAFVLLTNQGNPMAGQDVTFTWHYPAGDATCGATTDDTGAASCQQTIPVGTAGLTVWIDVGTTDGKYTAFTAVRPNRP